MSALSVFNKQLKREYLLKIRQPRLIINSFLLFLMIILFFPLALPAGMYDLKAIMPAIVWVSLLFAGLLSSEYLFQQEYEEGIFEQWIIADISISLLIGSKLLMHWLINVVPLLIACPLIGMLFNLNIYENWILFLTVLVGTPTIFSLCSLVAAFGIPLKQRGLFMALILLPLSIPVMIFGSGALSAAFAGLEVQGFIAILLAFSIITCSFLPFAIAGILKN